MDKIYSDESIQALLLSISDTAILVFCYDTPNFETFYKRNLESALTHKIDLVKRLINFSKRQGLLNHLIEWAEQNKSQGYGKHKPYQGDNSDLYFSNEVQPQGKIVGSGQATLRDSQEMAKDMHQAPKSPIDFLIITPLEEERNAVIDKLKTFPEFKRLPPSEKDIHIYYWVKLHTTFADGSTGMYRIVVMSLLGMGHNKASVATGDAIRRWLPKYVLLVGIAGGVGENEVRLGDILISDQVVDYELQKLKPEGPEVRWDTHRANPRLLEASFHFDDNVWQKRIARKRPGGGTIKRHIGPVGTGNKVIASREVLAKYRNIWPKLIGIEMEAGGVATATFQAAETPGFFMIRGVSDLANKEKNTRRVRKWRAYACEAAAAYAITLLQNGPVVPIDIMEDDPIERQYNRGGNFHHLELELELPGGAMDPESRFYIKRQADDKCWGYVQKSIPVTLVINAPRQMGKSSLLNQMMHRLEKEPAKLYVVVNFQTFSTQHFKDERFFFQTFCRKISQALHIPSKIDQHWQDMSADNENCSNYLSDHILPNIEKPFILMVDETERIWTSKFSDDFFSMLRSWHDHRANNKLFRMMSLLICSSTEPNLFIKDPNQSPFNVAHPIYLQDFTLGEVTELNERYYLPLKLTEVKELFELLGGHPYLTRKAFNFIVEGKCDLKKLLAYAMEEDFFGNDLHRYLLVILENEAFKETLTFILNYHKHEDSRIFRRLQAAGLIKREGHKVVFHNKLYARYFKEHLLNG